MMTKKEFKELSSVYVYGKGRNRLTMLFFDWKENDKGRGFKYMYGARGYTKADIIDESYDCIIKGNQSPWWAIVKIAQSDEQRFKVPFTM